MKFLSTTGAVLLPVASLVGAIDLSPDDKASIRSAAQTYAYGLMSSYTSNATDTPKEKIGYWPKPYYWWESGAVWGGLIEYTEFIGDQSYVKTIQQALTANYGPNNDVILPYLKDQEGNDDQAFWCLGLMSALEYNFPEPDNAPASYLDVTQNCWNNIVSRWDTTSCDGGLKWQIYPENSYGYDYKNAISNGATFALSARLARYTGNDTYADWAGKIYDWTKKVGLIGDNYEVFDGTDDKTGCKEVADKTEWTYNNAMFLHGSAFMYDYTKGDDTWKERTNGFLDRAAIFFDNPAKAEDVMFELCENSSKGCNLDQQSFKAYLSRWMAKTAILVPSTKDKVTTYLEKSAVAAAKACSGGDNGTTCGSKWYTGNFDGLTGVGEQLSAMEVTQALIMLQEGTVPSTGGDSKPEPSSSSAAASSTVASSKATAAPSSGKPSPASSPADSTGVPASPSSSSLLAKSPAASNAAGSSSPADATNPGGQFAEQKPTTAAAGVCTCTPTSTKTVWVNPPMSTPEASTLSVSIPSTYPVAPPVTTPAAPPNTTPAAVPSTMVVVPPGTPNTTANTTAPSAPPANSTTLPLFPGAASNVKLAGSTLFAAAALAVLATLL